jgi:hypothetical protein
MVTDGLGIFFNLCNEISHKDSPQLNSGLIPFQIFISNILEHMLSDITEITTSE